MLFARHLTSFIIAFAATQINQSSVNLRNERWMKRLSNTFRLSQHTMFIHLLILSLSLISPAFYTLLSLIIHFMGFIQQCNFFLAAFIQQCNSFLFPTYFICLCYFFNLLSARFQPDCHFNICILPLRYKTQFSGKQKHGPYC